MAYLPNNAFARAEQCLWRDSTDAAVLRGAVDRLKRSVEIAYFHCCEDEAADAHDDLICAEWRLQIAERRSQQ